MPNPTTDLDKLLQGTKYDQYGITQQQVDDSMQALRDVEDFSTDIKGALVGKTLLNYIVMLRRDAEQAQLVGPLVEALECLWHFSRRALRQHHRPALCQV